MNAWMNTHGGERVSSLATGCQGTQREEPSWNQDLHPLCGTGDLCGDDDDDDDDDDGGDEDDDGDNYDNGGDKNDDDDDDDDDSGDDEDDDDDEGSLTEELQEVEGWREGEGGLGTSCQMGRNTQAEHIKTH